MDLNKFTQKSQEGLQRAQEAAIRFGHVEVDVEHLLYALVESPEGLFPRILQKLDIAPDAFLAAAEEQLKKRPSVSGPGVEPGKVYITQRLNKLLVSAQDEARRLKDEYVSVEHLVLAMLAEGPQTAAGRIFK